MHGEYKGESSALMIGEKGDDDEVNWDGLGGNGGDTL